MSERWECDCPDCPTGWHTDPKRPDRVSLAFLAREVERLAPVSPPALSEFGQGCVAALFDAAKMIRAYDTPSH